MMRAFRILSADPRRTAGWIGLLAVYGTALWLTIVMGGV